MLYTISLICNLVVMTVYWSILHSEQMEIHMRDPGVGPARCFHLKIVHTIPGITCLINSYITKCLLKPPFYKSITAISMIYTLFVYAFYLTTGRIQYSFLKFDTQPIQAFSNVLIINLSATLLYMLLCTIDGHIK